MPSVVASPLGSPVPSFLPHAVSVSLPTWQDNVDYEEGAKRVVDVMKTGYPRFFIHRSIQKLATICEQKFGSTDEKCMIFPSNTYATACRDFIVRMSPSPTSCVRIVQFFISPDVDSQSHQSSPTPAHTHGAGERILSSSDLHITLFPSSHWPLAKAFWQHTGTGISSRFAEHCLRLLADSQKATHAQAETEIVPPKSPIRGKNRHYFSKGHTRSTSLTSPTLNEDEESSGYLEERYARNLHPNAAADAKDTLRRRIAGVLVREDLCSKTTNGASSTCTGANGSADKTILGPSTRGVANITEGDVFLFPGGMCAIWHTHQLLLNALGSRKSVCWGFPYVDTLKVLEKWGPGCHFFGHGTEFDELETLLETSSSSDSPILALFCEVTGNPLLSTPDLRRLRALADKYHFAIVVDETVGNFTNVEVLPYSDVVCSSLTKVFSGETNVMGGGLILNPQGQFYPKLKSTLQATYEDVYWDEDAIYLERNSRDFKQRVHTINKNAERICDLLRSRSLETRHSHLLAAETDISPPEANTTNRKLNGSHSTTNDIPKDAEGRPIVVKKVYYPKWITTETYNALRTPDGGYGGLFSITFISPLAAQAFFDGLGCEKGPSLGTNFTLACPFVILAHYTELEWVKQFGVDPYLVRISVGLESPEVLVGWIEGALKNAEEAVITGGLV